MIRHHETERQIRRLQPKTLITIGLVIAFVAACVLFARANNETGRAASIDNEIAVHSSGPGDAPKQRGEAVLALPDLTGVSSFEDTIMAAQEDMIIPARAHTHTKTTPTQHLTGVSTFEATIMAAQEDMIIPARAHACDST